MATFYLPSASTWYSTGNKYIKYRVKIVESNIKDGKKDLTFTIQAYKSSKSTANTSGNGTFILRVNNKNYDGKMVYKTHVFKADGDPRNYYSKKISGFTSTSVKVTSGFEFTNSSISADAKHTDTCSGMSPVTCKVTFDPNGGSMSGGAVGSKSYTTKQIITFNINDTYNTKKGLPGTHTRTGYYYDEWQKNGERVTSETKITKTHAVKIKWNVKKYNLKLNANGGTILNQSSHTISNGLIFNSTQNNNLKNYIPIRAGYKFVGWFDANKNEVYDANGLYASTTYWDGNKKLKKDIGNNGATLTLTALWEPSGGASMKTSDGWKQGIFYIKTSNGWKQTIPYIKTSNGWKQTT